MVVFDSCWSVPVDKVGGAIDGVDDPSGLISQDAGSTSCYRLLSDEAAQSQADVHIAQMGLVYQSDKCLQPFFKLLLLLWVLLVAKEITKITAKTVNVVVIGFYFP